MRLVPFLLVLAVFGLTGTQVASAAAATTTSTQASTPPAVVRVTRPHGRNILKPEQIALAARLAGFTGTRLVTAVAVAMAESSANANAISKSRAYGLWQILARAHPDMIKKSNPNASRWFDPYVNAKFAWKISNGGKNWRPWSVYNHGTYKKYLTQARFGVRVLTVRPWTIVPAMAK